LKISAEFITSAAGAADFPHDGLPEVALVGRSNVGKSSLINALLRQRVARTSAAPGKTRLANVYRVARGSSAPLYLVDLPGYGYARGGSNEFESLTQEYFSRGSRLDPPDSQRHETAVRLNPDATGEGDGPAGISALLLVDVRHPGLDSDRQAWQWLASSIECHAIVGTKIDKLARGQRIRALREIESVFEDSVLPVSAVTGEGLDELWKLIDRLASTRNPINPHRRKRIPLKEMARRRPKK
jgi:GTP-binding protein